MNIYDYHATPEKLIGGAEQYKLFHNVAYDLLITKNASTRKNNPKLYNDLINFAKTNARLALEYAGQIVDGAWKEGEHAIATDAKLAATYAKYVTRKRFPIAEPIISKAPHWKEMYDEFFGTDI